VAVTAEPLDDLPSAPADAPRRRRVFIPALTGPEAAALANREGEPEPNGGAVCVLLLAEAEAVEAVIARWVGQHERQREQREGERERREVRNRRERERKAAWV